MGHGNGTGGKLKDSLYFWYKQWGQVTREALFICQFEAGSSGFSPRRSALYRTTLPRYDFPQSAFRAEHDPFYEQPVASSPEV